MTASTLTRRELLTRIGLAAGAGAMYQSMASLGLAAESPYKGAVDLTGAKRGTSVIVLGAGLAGLVAAFELRHAGYDVKVLEYNQRAGGRSWTLRGGDEYTELGGFKQKCEFDPGLYINPGPWRLPYHHYGMLDYAKRLNVPLEAFNGLNFNAYLHSEKAFGGKPQRYRHVQTDFRGHVAELLSKATNQGALDTAISHEDKEMLLESLRHVGRLDKDFRYTAATNVSTSRGFDVDPGGGLSGKPVDSKPIGLDDLLHSNLWNFLATDFDYDISPSLFQPVGGMDRIAMALHKDIAPVVQFGAKVTAIQQSEKGVTVSYVDAQKGGPVQTAQAQYCVCTIPLSILSKIPMNVNDKMLTAIQTPQYFGSVKIGLQFKRKFWEEDERIYGGITYTDLPIQQISYPSTGMNMPGKGVLLGAYVWDVNAFEFTAMTPAQRVQKAVELGAQIHPQYKAEFENGLAVAWHRAPFVQGCFCFWTDAQREQHYRNVCEIDGRIVLAGEHASYLPAWQEGAVTSALDAIGRLHKKMVAHA